MARMKKNVSRDIQKAQQRLSGMKAISPTLDLGEGVSVTTFEAAVDLPVGLIAQYNRALSQADDLLNQINDATKDMTDLSIRALDGVKFKYGPDSSEYEMMGGKRKSERQKPLKKTGGTS